MFKVKFPGKEEYLEIKQPGDILDFEEELTKDNVQYESNHPEVQQLIADYADKWTRSYMTLLFELACVDNYLEQYNNGDEAIKPMLDNHINAVKQG